MKLWEGAVLVVGGIWLIGRISRQSPNHPANVAAANNAALQTAGATPNLAPNPPSTPSLETGDQAQSTGGLVAGEVLHTPVPTVANVPAPTSGVKPAPVTVSGGGKPPWIAPRPPRPTSGVRQSPRGLEL